MRYERDFEPEGDGPKTDGPAWWAPLAWIAGFVFGFWVWSKIIPLVITI